MYINKAIIYGNITKDLELAKTTNSQESVCNFSVATNRSYLGKDKQKHEDVQYHNVVVYGKKAETICTHLKKGSPILVEGRLMTRTWDGNQGKQYRTEIILEEFQFGPKPHMVGQEVHKEELDPNDIPF